MTTRNRNPGTEDPRGIPLLSETPEPRMGRTYLVTAIRTTWPMRPIAKPRPRVRWVPVMGPRHSDDDAVNFPPQHWHADPRFLDHGELWDDPSVSRLFRYFGKLRIRPRIRILPNPDSGGHPGAGHRGEP